MALPNEVLDSVREVEGYLFAIMNFATMIHDDHLSVRDPLQFMGRDVIERWEVIKDYLERQQAKPNLGSVSNFQKDEFL